MTRPSRSEQTYFARLEAQRRRELRWRSMEKAAAREGQHHRPEPTPREEEPLLFRLVEALAY